MATIKKDNSFNPFNVDEGIYKAVVLSVEEKQGPHSMFLVWNFRIVDPIQSGEYTEGEIKLSGSTPLYLQDDSKLDKWLKVCGIEVADGDDIDTDEAVGSVVSVLVEDHKKDDKVYSRVEKIMKAKKKKKPGPEDDDDEDAKAKKKKAAAKKKAAEKARKESDDGGEDEAPPGSRDPGDDDPNLYDFSDDDS